MHQQSGIGVQGVKIREHPSVAGFADRPVHRTGRVEAVVAGGQVVAVGMGAAFDGLDGGEEAAEGNRVALGICRVEQPVLDRCVEDLLLGHAALGQGQLRPDGALEVTKRGVLAGRGAHLFLHADGPRPRTGQAPAL